jgi:hypothetical protein
MNIVRYPGIQVEIAKKATSEISVLLVEKLSSWYHMGLALE